MPSYTKAKPASGPDFGYDANRSISLFVMPWLMFQSDGHFVVSMLNPAGPTYRFLLFGSWPYLPVPTAGITGPGVVAPADVDAPPAVVVAPAVLAVVPDVAGVVVAADPLLLSPPHAAATKPADTSRVAGTTHRCFFTRSPYGLFEW